MKLSESFVSHFTDEWINSWNKADLEGIMKHYDENVLFLSPFIIKSKLNTEGIIRGKSMLRNYFQRALHNNPDLHFDLQHVMVGINSLTLIYLRKKSLLSSELMIFNEAGLVCEGRSHYPHQNIYQLLG